MSPSARNNDTPGYAVYKLIVSLLLVGLAASAAVVFLVVATPYFAPGDIFDGWEVGRQALAYFDGFEGGRRVLVAGFAAVLGFAFLSVLLRMWSGARRSPGPALHILDADDLGRVWVDGRSVAVVARQAALAVRGVLDAEVRVNGSVMAPVEMQVEVDYYPGAKLKESGVEVRTAVRKAVVELVGLEVRSVEVRENVLDPDELTRMLR